MRKFRINWTWIFWTSLTILFLWLLAKALGLIHTPLIIEAILYITGFATILAAGKKIGEYAQQLTRAIVDISEIKGEIKEVKEYVQGLRKDVHRLDKRLSIVETKIGILKPSISA